MISKSIIIGSLVTVSPQPAAVQSGPFDVSRDLCTQGSFPEPAAIGPGGVQTLYVFAVEGAPEADLESFLKNIGKSPFGLQMLRLNVDGRESLLVMGAEGLRTTVDMRREYLSACTLRVGKAIHLSSMKHNKGTEEPNVNKVTTAAAAAAALATLPVSPATASVPILVVQESGSSTVFDITVTGGAEKIWTGNLRVNADRGNSSYQQNVNQPYEPCAGQTNASERGGSSRSSLQINISQREREVANQFQVSTQWVRPRSLCEGGGSASVQFDQAARVAPGETVKLTGDGGLSVTLRRRP